jgi:hypothetical protein
MKYKIYRRKKRLNGNVKYSKDLPYVFNPSYHKSENIIDISKLSIFNKDMINNIIEQKYIRKYKALLKMVYLLFHDAFPGDSGYPAVLGQVDKLRATLIDKYNKYLALENQKKFLKELDYIEAEVKKKFIEERMLVQQFVQGNMMR